jgi:stage III sporulation protein AG
LRERGDKLFGFLRRRQGYIEVEQPGTMGYNKKSKILIIIIAVSVLIFAFSDFGGGDDKDNKKYQTSESSEETAKLFVAENEKRLNEIISAMQGAGSVKVMITTEDSGEKIVALDKISETSQENDKESTSKNLKQEQTTLVFGNGDNEKPFVIKENLPKPSGVLVVATGAGDESVRLEVYEAVKALYGISGHRIKVTKGSIK